MKIILRNKTHGDNKSHDMTIVEFKGKKIKITYETYNSVERYNGEVFAGDKLEHIFTLPDLGEKPNPSAYLLLKPAEREKRVDELFKSATKFIKALM